MLKIAPKESGELAGKIMMIVEAFTQIPVTVWYEENERCNDKIWAKKLLEKLPEAGLLIVDLGFFSFVWFDQFTDHNKFFLTRMRQKTAYQVNQVLSEGLYYRDEIIHLGKYRSNPSDHPVRLVSVLWGNTWYRYLTNVLSDQQISAQ